MPTRDRLRQDDVEGARPKGTTPQPGPSGPLELAGQIGNSSMQRVAGSAALQRSPAAAGLLQRSTLARESEDEGPAAATPDAEVTAPAASPEGGVEKLDEDVPETTGESGVEKLAPEVPAPPAYFGPGKGDAADTGVSKQPEVPAGLVGPRGIESGKESEDAAGPAATQGGTSKVAGSESKDEAEDEAA